MLRVLFGDIGVRIGRQSVSSDFERRHEDSKWGFAGDAHDGNFCQKSRNVQGEIVVFYRALLTPFLSPVLSWAS